jgi:hypothetical protein
VPIICGDNDDQHSEIFSNFIFWDDQRTIRICQSACHSPLYQLLSLSVSGSSVINCRVHDVVQFRSLNCNSKMEHSDFLNSMWFRCSW